MVTTPVEIYSEPLFVDTNIWLYATDPESRFHAKAQAALDTAQQAGITLVTSPQILREYLAVSTRPGIISATPSLIDLLSNVAEIRLRCQLIEETSGVVDQLANLLGSIPTTIRRIHDANIVATMLYGGVPTLLTHNSRDFAIYTTLISVLPLE